MKSFAYCIILCIGICIQTTRAQIDTLKRWHVGAGAAFPAAPDPFFDYWNAGFQATGGIELPSSTRFIQFISAEIGYFGFNQQRFLKRIGLENSETSISGSATYTFSLSYIIRYPFIEYRKFRPTFFAGIGCADIFRSKATIDYPNAPTTQGSANSIVVTVPFGASVAVFERNNKAIEVALMYTMGLSKNQNINSDFTSLRIEYIFSR